MGTLNVLGNSSLTLAPGTHTFAAVTVNSSTLSVAGDANSPFTVPSLSLTAGSVADQSRRLA